jgi:hypothetical protein
VAGENINMKITIYILIASIIMIIFASSLEAALINPAHYYQQKEKDDEKNKKKLKEIIPLPKTFYVLEQKTALNFSLALTYEDQPLIKEKSPLSLTYSSLGSKFMGLNSFFGGPVNRYTGDPLLERILIPVYSINRDPVTGKFWWD